MVTTQEERMWIIVSFLLQLEKCVEFQIHLRNRCRDSLDSEQNLTMETCAVFVINKQRIVCLLSEWQEGQQWPRETDGQGLQGASGALELQSCFTSPRALTKPETFSRVLGSPDGWKWAQADLTGWLLPPALLFYLNGGLWHSLEANQPLLLHKLPPDTRACHDTEAADEDYLIFVG